MKFFTARSCLEPLKDEELDKKRENSRLIKTHVGHLERESRVQFASLQHSPTVHTVLVHLPFPIGSWQGVNPLFPRRPVLPATFSIPFIHHLSSPVPTVALDTFFSSLSTPSQLFFISYYLFGIGHCPLILPNLLGHPLIYLILMHIVSSPLSFLNNTNTKLQSTLV